MAEESLRDFLDRREREVLNRLIAMKSIVSDLEGEYAEIRTAKSALDAPLSSGAILNELTGGLPYSTPIPGALGLAGAEYPKNTLRMLSSGIASGRNPLMPEPSIRDLIMSAFKKKPEFGRYGATNKDLREFIKDTTGRDIERTSLSPALSRLRDEGVLMSIQEPGQDGKWKPNVR